MHTETPQFFEPRKEDKENPNNFSIYGMIEGSENQKEKVGYFIRDGDNNIRFESTSEYTKKLFGEKDYLSGSVKIEPNGAIYIYPDNPPYPTTIAEIEQTQPVNKNLQPRPTLTLMISTDTDYNWVLEDSVYEELQEWLKK